MQLSRGQKVKLQDVVNNLDIQVGVQLNSQAQESIDVTCFGVDSANQLSDDRYFIFFNQPASPEGAIKKLGSAFGDTERFEVSLSRLASSIKKLVFTASIDGQGAMNQLSSGYVRLLHKNEEVARFAFSGTDFAQEKAIILCEIYLKDVWRFAAVGQGFNGGLNALLKHFGGEEAEVRAAPPPPAPLPAPSPPPAPITPKVNLAKVTLEKRGDKRTIDLSKKDVSQPIHINLNWMQTVSKSGFFGSKKIEADLDLGCMVEMKDGQKGVIQALGKNFGQKDVSPYIYLDKDDRSGVSTDGENLFILRPDLIKKVMVFAFIYQGTANFADVHGRIIIKDVVGNETTIYLDNSDSSNGFCAICLIENSGDRITITKEEAYFKGHAMADKKYGFGFQWTAGSK